MGKKFEQFGWKSFSVDGHSIENLYKLFNKIKNKSYSKPIAIISNTFKGGSIKKLRDIDICHVISLSDEEVKTHKVKIK